MTQLRVRTEPIRIPLLGVVALLGCSRCDRAVPEGEQPERRVVVVSAGTGGVGQGTPVAPTQANVPGITSAAGAPTAAVTAPHPGPWLTVLQPSIAIYSEPSADRSNKLGYAQSGAKIAVQGSPKPSDKCASGWIEVVPTGYVCTATGTLDEKDPRIKFTLKPPSLENVLPYTYARNGKNGTPLYRSIPTRAQMLEYEPYLRKEDKPAATDAAVQAGGAGSTSTVAASSAASPTPSPAPATSNGVVAAPPQTTANPENS